MVGDGRISWEVVVSGGRISGHLRPSPTKWQELVGIDRRWKEVVGIDRWKEVVGSTICFTSYHLLPPSTTSYHLLPPATTSHYLRPSPTTSDQVVGAGKRW